MTKTTDRSRNVIALGSGVSLDSVSEGDVIVYNGHRELVSTADPVQIQTLRRLHEVDQDSPIMIRQRWLTDYQPSTGAFRSDGKADVVTLRHDPERYFLLDKTLEEAGL